MSLSSGKQRTQSHKMLIPSWEQWAERIGAERLPFSDAINWYISR